MSFQSKGLIDKAKLCFIMSFLYSYKNVLGLYNSNMKDMLELCLVTTAT